MLLLWRCLSPTSRDVLTHTVRYNSYTYVFIICKGSTWNGDSSYSILLGKLLFPSCIRLLWIKIQNDLLFHKILLVGLATLPCDILQCEFSSASYHSIHLGLQYPVNIVLSYSKDFSPFLGRNETKIKLFCFLSLDDFFLNHVLQAVGLSCFYCFLLLQIKFWLPDAIVTVVDYMPVPWNLELLNLCTCFTVSFLFCFSNDSEFSLSLPSGLNCLSQ